MAKITSFIITKKSPSFMQLLAYEEHKQKLGACREKKLHFNFSQIFSNFYFLHFFLKFFWARNGLRAKLYIDNDLSPLKPCQSPPLALYCQYPRSLASV